VSVLTLLVRIHHVRFRVKSVDAVTLRRSLGRILRELERGGEPILVERRRQAAAVLISLRDYRERFVDREADTQRRDLVARMKALRFVTRRGRTTLDLLRSIRSGRT